MKMQKYFIILSPFFVSSCSYFFQGQLELFLTENQVPLKDTQVMLYGKKNQDEKEIFIGKYSSDNEGKVAAHINFFQYHNLKIIVSNQDLEKIILPSIQSMESPRWWQEQVVKLHLDVPQFIPKQDNLVKIPTIVQPLPDVFLNPPPEIVSIQQFEGNLYEEPVIKKGMHNLQNNLSTQPSIIKNTNTNKTITDKFVDFSAVANLKISSQNNPVEKAKIYLGYNGSQTIKYQGESSRTGAIDVHYNKAVAPDILIIKKRGFVTNVTPFIENVSTQSLLLEMKPGKSMDFLIENFAYGAGRGTDKAELLLNGIKQDVSSILGFLTLAKEVQQTDILSIEQKNSIITNISSEDLKRHYSHKSEDLVGLFIPTLIPYKPNVGFIEPNISGALESNMLWRRVRREFFSRYINEQSFKTKIIDDLIKIVNVKKDSVLDLLKKGWQNASFAKDIDMLLQIDFVQNEEQPIVTGKIYAKNGLLIAEQRKSFDATNAEQVSGQLYESLVAQLPIEAYVTQQEKGVFTLNVGKKHHINKGDLFAAHIPQNFYSPPNRPVGVLKIIDISDTESKAKVIIGVDKLKSNMSILAIRYPEAFIEEQIKKQVAQGLTTME